MSVEVASPMVAGHLRTAALSAPAGPKTENCSNPFYFCQIPKIWRYHKEN